MVSNTVAPPMMKKQTGTGAFLVNQENVLNGFMEIDVVDTIAHWIEDSYSKDLWHRTGLGSHKHIRYIVSPDIYTMMILRWL